MSASDGGDSTDAIVSTQWLNSNLNKPEVRILDVSWYSAKDAQDDYLKEHIPGAVFFDLFKDVQNTDVLPRNVPDASVFEANAQCAGVNSDSHVIVYDAEGKCGYFLGARAWWTFQYFGHSRVSILDGGLQKWKNDGFKTTADLPEVAKGNFKAQINQNIRKDATFMKQQVAKTDIQVLDSRPPELYNGKPEDAKSGHYPGAINIPFAANLLNKDQGTFKSSDELRKMFSERGVSLDKPIVTMCNSGMSSCSLLLAARLAGNTQNAVFQGGFTEWKHVADETEIEKS